MQMVEITKGEGVHIQLRWADAGGPINLTGRTLQILEASNPALLQGQFDVPAPATGEARLDIPAPGLALGRHWIRVGMTLPNGRMDSTPRIWINVT